MGTAVVTRGAQAVQRVSQRAVQVASRVSQGVSKTSTKSISNSKPLQQHHFLSDKSKVYTPQFEEIISKYNLRLNEAWNKELMPHQGRHPNAYHDFMLQSTKEFDMIAKGETELFLDLFSALKQKIVSNPDMLYKEYWRHLK